MKIYIDDAYNIIHEVLSDRDLKFYSEFKDKSDLINILSRDFPCQFERVTINESLDYLTIERLFNMADNYRN